MLLLMHNTMKNYITTKCIWRPIPHKGFMHGHIFMLEIQNEVQEKNKSLIYKVDLKTYECH
jgi:hypothetical protein